MKKIFGTLVLVVALFAPTQIVLAEMHITVTEKAAEIQLHMGECAVMINRMVRPGSNVSMAKLREIKKLLDEIDRLTLQLRALGGNG